MTEQIQTLYGRLECICRDLQVLCKVFSIGSFSNVSDGGGDGKEDVKKAIGLSRKKNNNFARASRFFVHFFTVLARLRRENA